MGLKIDSFTNFAEFVIDAGKVTLGIQQRMQMDSLLRTQQNEVILQAVCALLNSGGGVIKAEIENKDYIYEIHGIGLDLPPVFRSNLDEMQQGNLFFLFVKSWDTEASGLRLATLCCNLYYRHETSTDIMDSQEALEFLNKKSRTLRALYDPNSLHSEEAQVGGHYETGTTAMAATLFGRVQLQYLERLYFTESLHVEFQMFSADPVQCIKEQLPKCVSAFANAEGGYVFFGVHDETHQVIGCEKEKISLPSLRESVNGCIRKLPVHHFCSQRHIIQYAIKCLEVHDKGTLRGYVFAVRVEPFCCAVFAKVPSSWQVKDNRVRQLATKEWVAWMMEADPDLSRFPEMVLARSLSYATPHSRTVCTHKNLECLKEMQKRHFSVSSDRIVYTPESVYKELFSQHKGLRDLINMEMRPISQGILIFSSSWAVDLGLQEKQSVVCDALLISQNNNPILYTVFKCDRDWKNYSITVAHSLKQRLVNTGGYTGRLCVIPLAFLLNPDKTVRPLCNSEVQIYPESYSLLTTQHMEALLQSLVIVLFGSRSFLSEELGSEVLNLLTDQQYELLSKDLRKTREMFVHGLTGSGKTMLALRIIEKIRNVFHCQASNILYICENQPLKKFVSRRNMFQAVTRKNFMKSDFGRIQHIIIDEAHNFHAEDGDWYRKAKAITQRERNCPGILWIFLDYFQTSHLCCSGLPPLSVQFPRTELTRVFRNADVIASYLQETMQNIRENPPPNIPPGSLVMCQKPKWTQGVPGNLEITEYPDLEGTVIYVADKCQLLWRNGYSPKDIAVLLFSRASEIEKYRDNLLLVLRRRRMSQLTEGSNPFILVRDALGALVDYIMLDSVHRFSGLERNTVFGIIPSAVEPTIYYNILFCLASRARYHLYILKVSV
uniref:Schlafen family member 5 n=1 Tax=Castor canadensis TaxID=51338 RepID=A0A250YLR6_CASCN